MSEYSLKERVQMLTSSLVYGGPMTFEQIKKLEERREKRRQLMQQRKEENEEAKLRNEKAGRNVDLEYDRMIHENWLSEEIASEHVQSEKMKICV